ncbi:hypothetical protein TNCV_4405411 [Trichonephila clavipes]|uniref:Uncharacterized protein n=1 Tax=Trichonephila clavipes TaxID=2585209 RepID=A0A8X6S728_TRICX|nr:hypothetical protein TNCV_4405411 [Trichonephila clavipes]
MIKERGRLMSSGTPSPNFHITSTVGRLHIDIFNASREAGWSNRRIGRPSVGAMVVARCWQQWITDANRREDQDVPGTQMIARINQKSGHFGTNNVASIDSTPLTSFQTSSAIKRNHKETTDRSWREPMSAKTLPH